MFVSLIIITGTKLSRYWYISTTIETALEYYVQESHYPDQNYISRTSFVHILQLIQVRLPITRWPRYGFDSLYIPLAMTFSFWLRENGGNQFLSKFQSWSAWNTV